MTSEDDGFRMPEPRRVLRVGDGGVWPSGRAEVAVVLRREDVRTSEQREALVAWFRGLLLSGVSGLPFPVVVDRSLPDGVLEVRDTDGRTVARRVLP